MDKRTKPLCDCSHCRPWQKVTGCKSPEDANVWITALQMDITELRRNIDELLQEPENEFPERYV